MSSGKGRLMPWARGYLSENSRYFPISRHIFSILAICQSILGVWVFVGNFYITQHSLCHLRHNFLYQRQFLEYAGYCFVALTFVCHPHRPWESHRQGLSSHWVSRTHVMCWHRPMGQDPLRCCWGWGVCILQVEDYLVGVQGSLVGSMFLFLLVVPLGAARVRVFLILFNAFIFFCNINWFYTFFSSSIKYIIYNFSKLLSVLSLFHIQLSFILSKIALTISKKSFNWSDKNNSSLAPEKT